MTGAIIFVIPTDLGYILGAAGAWIPASKFATLVLTGGVLAGITLVAIRDLDIGKWLHNVGSIGVMAAYVILLGLPLWALLRGTITHYAPIPWQPPRPSWFGLAVFGQMTVGALSGFEYVAILAGESRNAARLAQNQRVYVRTKMAWPKFKNSIDCRCTCGKQTLGSQPFTLS